MFKYSEYSMSMTFDIYLMVLDVPCIYLNSSGFTTFSFHIHTHAPSRDWCVKIVVLHRDSIVELCPEWLGCGWLVTRAFLNAK